jgi:hypothetical protein
VQRDLRGYRHADPAPADPGSACDSEGAGVMSVQDFDSSVEDIAGAALGLDVSGL